MKTTSLILFERSRILVITRKKYVAIIFVLLLGSCKVYSPRIIPIHQFKGKDDVFISGNITIPTGISGSVAYSPFSHSSIQVHMAVAPEASYYFQGTTGAYWGNGSSTNFEILAGYGNGKGKAIKSPNPAFLKGKYDLYFTQFNIGQSIKKWKKIEYGIGIKTGIFNVKISDYGFYESDGLDPTEYHNRYILLEPTAYLRKQGVRLSTGLYMSGTTFINVIPNQKMFPFNGLSFGLSIEYKIAGKI